MALDLEKLKKIPLFKNVDFEDPRARQRLGLVFGLFAMMILALVLNLAKKTDTDGQSISQAENVLLEIPSGEDNDILSQEDMLAIHDQKNPGNKALFEESRSLNVDDPLSFLNEEEEKMKDRQTSREEDRDIHKKNALAAFGITDDDSGKDSQGQPDNALAETIDKAAAAPSTLRDALAESSSSRITPASANSGAKKSREEIEAQEDQENRTVNKPAKKMTPSSGRSRTLADAERQKRDGTTTTTQSRQQGDDTQEEAPRAVRRSGGISSLDGDWGTIEGITSLDSESQYVTQDDDHPYKVMFTRDQKIKSGDRISIRLMEDMAVDGVLIPKNTHLSATCQIGERLQIIVSNIELGGRIYALNYVAFDNDGSQGLYCPISGATQTSDKSKNAAVQSASQIISSTASLAGAAMGSSAMGSMLGNMANIGASAVTSRNGSVTAQVNSGYTFYLLKN